MNASTLGPLDVAAGCALMSAAATSRIIWGLFDGAPASKAGRSQVNGPCQ
jgi:hypothetical protein